MGRRQSFPDLSYGLVIGGIAILAVLIIVAPVVIVLMTSFTEGRSLKFPPTGFSFGWYEQLFDPAKSRQIHRAAGNSLEVAALSTLIGVVLATLAALGLARNRAQVGARRRQLLHVAAGPARHHLRPGGAGLLLDCWASGRRST